jgi:hypothetical protein
MEPLSPKALGILIHIRSFGALRGAEGLSEAFQTGVKVIRSGLSELRSKGYVALEKGRGQGGQYWSQLLITEEGLEYLSRYAEKADGRSAKKERGPHAKKGNSISQNSNIANYPNSLYTNSLLKEGPTESDHNETFETMDLKIGEQMLGGDPIDPDDLAELKAKDRERKRREKTEARQSRHADKVIELASRETKDWTPSQVSTYFADQMKQIWHIAAWTTTRSGLNGAIELLREKHGTNGEEEKTLIDKFLSTIKHDKGLDNPDMVWRMFAKRAPGMLPDIRRSSNTDVDVAALKEDASKSWEGFNV